jgi:hypothetical protein
MPYIVGSMNGVSLLGRAAQQDYMLCLKHKKWTPTPILPHLLLGLLSWLLTLAVLELGASPAVC